MSTSMPADTPKKSKRKWILIGAAGLSGLCLICLVIGLVTTNSPTYKATQAAKTAVAAVESTSAPAQPADTKAQEKAAEPTKPPEPTKTKAPTNTPAPTDTPAPTATSTPAPQPVEVSGSGDQIAEVDIPFRLGFAHLVYSGEHNFIVTSYNKDNEPVDVLVNEIGSYDGYRPIDFLDDQKTTRLEVKASGPWTITIYPLAKEYMRVCQIPGTCQGRGDDVIVLMGGTPDIGKFKYTGEHNFIVTGYGGAYPDGLVNEIGAYEGTVMFAKKTMVLAIISSGEWEVEITTK